MALHRFELSGAEHGTSLELPLPEVLADPVLDVIWTGREFGMAWSAFVRDAADGHQSVSFARASFCD
jgi:hypothetical protein